MKGHVPALLVMVFVNLTVAALGGPAWAAFGLSFIAYLLVVR